jgi:hypothetical protein
MSAIHQIGFDRQKIISQFYKIMELYPISLNLICCLVCVKMNETFLCFQKI